MKNLRTILVALGLVVVPVLLLMAMLGVADGTMAPKPGVFAPGGETASGGGWSPLATLIVQMAAIIALSRVVALGLMKLKQPRVVGEIAAGLLLGPSLLGVLSPELYATLFPASSFSLLGMFANIGVVLFMFLVGIEFQPKLLQGQGATVAVTSHAAIVVPFLAGVALAFAIFEPLAPAGVDFRSFALFIGAAFSVTAFPVLARILSERKLTRTRMGVVALGVAAICNAAAWLILAGVTVLVRATEGGTPIWLTVTAVLAYAAAALFGLRPLLAWLYERTDKRAWVGQTGLALILMLVLINAFATDRLGLHALFGGFIAGLVLPKEDALTDGLLAKLEDFTVVFMLPLYFAFTGLRTSFGSLGTAEGWFFMTVILAVAVAGKLVGATLAAKATGSSWRDAAGVGVLVNTRALMELIIINMALDLGVITTDLFSMLVIMALATTAMTTPLLDWLYPRQTDNEAAPAAPSEPLVLAGSA